MLRLGRRRPVLVIGLVIEFSVSMSVGYLVGGPRPDVTHLRAADAAHRSRGRRTGGVRAPEAEQQRERFGGRGDMAGQLAG